MRSEIVEAKDITGIIKRYAINGFSLHSSEPLQNGFYKLTFYPPMKVDITELEQGLKI